MTGPLLSATVRAVFFDAVGTLIHPEPPAPVVYHRVARTFGSRCTLDDIGRRFREAFQREEARDRAAGLRTCEEREVQRWRSIVAAVLDDASDPEACFRELYDHFTRPASWRLETGAGEVLSQLEERGLQLGMASNFDHRLRGVAAGLAPLRPVTQLVISSEIGWRKPAPAFFAAVCRSAGLAPEQIVLVGDDVANDYEGARSAGMTAVLLDPKGAAGDGVRRIDGLKELLDGL